MAKQCNGYMGGYSGKLGPAVGYLWNGKWCLRSRPTHVRNPRSERQMECRSLFTQEVRLAARMSRSVNIGLTDAARAAGMTSYNLFVRLNQQAFSLEGDTLQVDYTQLTLSVGPVAPVAFHSLAVGEGNVLSVSFDKNPQHLRSNHYDAVHLCVYCPENRQEFLVLPVNRRDEAISVVLPSFFAGREVHVYGFVVDDMGRCSQSQYVGSALMTSTVADSREVKVDAIENQAKKTKRKKANSVAHAADVPVDGAPSDPATRRLDALPSQETPSEPTPPPDPPDINQLSLF